MLNMVRLPKIDGKVCKKASCKSKSKAPAVLLLIFHDDSRLFMHVHKLSIAKVVAIVVPWVGC